MASTLNDITVMITRLFILSLKTKFSLKRAKYGLRKSYLTERLTGSFSKALYLRKY